MPILWGEADIQSAIEKTLRIVLDGQPDIGEGALILAAREQAEFVRLDELVDPFWGADHVMDVENGDPILGAIARVHPHDLEVGIVNEIRSDRSGPIALWGKPGLENYEFRPDLDGERNIGASTKNLQPF